LGKNCRKGKWKSVAPLLWQVPLKTFGHKPVSGRSGIAKLLITFFILCFASELIFITPHKPIKSHNISVRDSLFSLPRKKAYSHEPIPYKGSQPATSLIAGVMNFVQISRSESAFLSIGSWSVMAAQLRVNSLGEIIQDKCQAPAGFSENDSPLQGCL
jgi:hypothetical protein